MDLPALAGAVPAACRQVLSRPLRGILLRTLGLTALLLVAVWLALTDGLAALLRSHPLSADYPLVNGIAAFLAGAGLVVAFAYLLPAVSAAVAGFFLDGAAGIVERTDFPADPPGRDMSVATSLVYGLKFAALALGVNLVALLLLFVPGINAVAFFGANAYLFGRAYFEMAAARFRPIPQAVQLRRDNRLLVLAAGGVLAALMLVPIVNLAVPIFGIALMVHVHKAAEARRAGLLPAGAA